MKKTTNTFLFIASALLCNAAFAQIAQPSTFEDLSLLPDSYNDGASGSGDFSSGSATFNNSYNTGFGYWEAGFAYSNRGDTATGPSDYMTQLYACKAGTGHLGSANFGIGTLNAGVKLDSPAVYTEGIWVTNTTYAYNSMALGDGFGKKFGDTSASVHSAAGVNEGYPDWFRLSIVGYWHGAPVDTVDFYLADFRFADDTQDYIVKDWQYVDLSTMRGTDSLGFFLSSSDNGSFGMNTPAYFCVDDFTASEIVTGVPVMQLQQNIDVYPNPAADQVTLDMKTTTPRIISIYNASGQLLLEDQTSAVTETLQLSGFEAGIYFVKVLENDRVTTKRIVKKQ